MTSPGWLLGTSQGAGVPSRPYGRNGVSPAVAKAQLSFAHAEAAPASRRLSRGASRPRSICEWRASRSFRQARPQIGNDEVGIYKALVVGRVLAAIAALAIHPVHLIAINPRNRLADASLVLYHHSWLQIVVHVPTYSF